MQSHDCGAAPAQEVFEHVKATQSMYSRVMSHDLYLLKRAAYGVWGTMLRLRRFPQLQ